MRKKRLRHKNKKLQGQLYKYEFADPEIQRPLEGSRKVAWAKLGVWPLHGGEKQTGLSEGHAVMASQWLDVGKKEHLKGKPNYTPKRKSRIVPCWNWLSGDSPASDLETRHIVASWAASKGAVLRS